MTDIDRTTARRVLDLELPDNGANAETVRDYLIALLLEVWDQEQDFSGKRPFGNSGWQHEIYAPLVRAGFTPGSFNEYDELDGEFDYRDADKLILAAIEELGRVTS
ncbi:hypothetical protein GCM10010172_07380 [Paractinoplanes ferrugineus]|uniref:Uncharacterized protein n=1 Tax=Paractinoplanes ferrugineus TaxID=113564 RepID=A0A919JBW4_9ACTN|nr:hypothetical protein [Actinoplanes ferrugineus]GIE16783.1 hypothetical protein Afe05nite_86230 [Actinoplanes ferrugineus]